MATRRVVFLQISFSRPEDPAAPLARALLSALSPDVVPPFYRRQWRLSRPAVLEEVNALWGKLGFERETAAYRYDDAEQDFVEVAGTEGHASYTEYVVSMETGIVAVEEAPPDITAASIRAGFRAILRESYPDLGLVVDYVNVQPDFEQWLDEVDAVQRVTMTIHQPNPHFGQATQAAEDLLATRAKSVQVTALAEAGDTVEVAGTALEEIANHAKRYGRIRAQGQVDDRRVDFNSDETRVTAAVSRPDDETGAPLARRMLDLARAVLGR